ncbi:LysR family transcriptional regulator [Alkalicoccus saliphilus]|uniref:LysR family transcriptional regulator n=1 Tax=Alkalicoccus saliphilus TaxID=200989 RepID=A0A2T4U2W0_9BACI|nr:LysR family transcriptional regulator [Alkalicoccus saliphilus]PTL37742.1 LysR family transcriptional regulator [Alkalicoccus saliphilus]
MDEQQLRYFVTAAEMEHITKAAETLSVSQPALSRAVTRLERELGAPLFERHGRSVSVTSFGKEFLKRSRRILQEFDAARQDALDLQAPDRGKISLGFLHTLSTGLIPDLLAGYKARYPDVHFILGQGPSHTLLEQLEDGVFDLCLTALPEFSSKVSWEPLWEEELFIILPAGHPLAEKERLNLSDIQKDPFIHLKQGYSLRRSVERLFREAGLPLSFAFEGDEADTVAGLVGAGLGVSILPAQQTADPSQVVQVPIAFPRALRTIGLSRIQQTSASPAVQAFAEYIRRVLAGELKNE